MHTKSFLAAFIVCSGLTSVQPDNVVETNPGGVRENFRNFFDSIKKNDADKTGNYRTFLEQEAAKEQQAFDTMKDEISHRHTSKPRILHLRSGDIRPRVQFKREVPGGSMTPGQNDSAAQRPQPNLNPDPEQTMKAVETIRSSSRKDVLVWQTELLETQKYFDKLKEQNAYEEKMSQSEDGTFRQWAEKTEERMSQLFGAMASRLSELEKESAQTTSKPAQC